MTSCAAVLDDSPQLVVVLAGIADPGNAGTVLRTADAAGADAVVFPEGTVDPYNGKCVRASAGSLFHVDVVRGGERGGGGARAAGGRADRAGGRCPRRASTSTTCSDAGGLARPYGLGVRLGGARPARPSWPSGPTRGCRVPIYGLAESLNLAAAAAVCLYASARAQRHPGAPS